MVRGEGLNQDKNWKTKWHDIAYFSTTIKLAFQKKEQEKHHTKCTTKDGPCLKIQLIIN